MLRRPAFDIDELTQVVWNPEAVEFSAAANAVSLLMPYVEPWFASSVRQAIPHLAPEAADDARAFVRQELEHQRQHRRFNRVVTERVPGLVRPQRRMRSVYGWLARTRSLPFALAFAAASETIAYSLARWTSDHLAEFTRGADPAVSELFLWHLAEEVEHKAVAFDAWTALDGRHGRYARAGVVSLVLLAWLSLWSILVMLHADRRLHRVGTWWRLGRLVLSFTFEVVPNLFVSSLPGHHPDQMSDPDWYGLWLVDLELRHGLRDDAGQLSTVMANSGQLSAASAALASRSSGTRPSSPSASTRSTA